MWGREGGRRKVGAGRRKEEGGRWKEEGEMAREVWGDVVGGRWSAGGGGLWATWSAPPAFPPKRPANRSNEGGRSRVTPFKRKRTG
jgi:hypothetical protein